MKIRKIAFKNINNLKGEHEILFDALPLSTAGIFAITGPTGSGKSTILDVITLALFNRIPRFSKAISKGEIEGQGSILTHYTREAKAEIVYEVKGIVYTSSWSIAVNRNNKLNDYEMYLKKGLRLEDLKRREVPARNEEIIGLKYDQFIKSILLSQGEFSRFLKADKNERGQLLEDITGTSIYRKIGLKADEQYKQLKTEVANESRLLEEVKTLTTEGRDQYKHSIKINTEKKSALDKELVKLNEQKTIKFQLTEVRKSKNEKTAQLESLTLDIKQFAKQLKKLETHQKISPIQGDLALYSKAEEETSSRKRTIEELKTDHKKANDTYTVILQNMSNLVGQQVNESTFMNLMSTFERQIIELDNQVKNVRAKGKEDRERINTKLPKLAISISVKAAPFQAIQELKERDNTLSSQIKEAAIRPTDDLQKINAQLIKDKEEVQLLDKIAHAYEHLTLEKQQLQTATAQLKEYKATQETYMPLLEKTQQLLASQETSLAALEKQKELELQVASMESHRPHLVDGKPCPLCGATEHPFAEEGMVPAATETVSKIKVLQQQKAAEQKKAETLVANVNQGVATIKLTENRVKELTTQAEKATEITKQMVATYQGKWDIQPSKINNSLEQFSLQNDRVSKALAALAETQLIHELQKDYQQLSSTFDQFKALNEERKKKYTGTDVSTDCNQIQNEFNTCKESLRVLQTKLKAEEKALAAAKKTINDLNIKLKPQIVALGFAHLHEVSEALLSQKEATSIQTKKDNLDHQKTALQTTIKSLSTKLEELRSLDANPGLELTPLLLQIKEKEQAREQFLLEIGDHQRILARDEEDQKRIAKRKAKIEKLTKKLDLWALLWKMIGDASGNKFANFAQGLTLQNLLVHANRRLKNLSDRYLLDMPTKDGSLNVIDQYQGNIQRAVTTLSGGESFVISLALALSLSDMASKNVALESLFIDEGFGTLDPETLDIAMNTLEKLQSESQKTVAVISHVEALKERIHVQIRLEKNAQGYGVVRVE